MLFNASEYRHCVYCTHGAEMDHGQILCDKHGIRAPESKCVSFSYDPLKRRPVPKNSRQEDYSKRDFSL